MYTNTVIPVHITYGGRASTLTRVGLLSDIRGYQTRQPFICHQFYEHNHISTNCQLLFDNMAQ